MSNYSEEGSEANVDEDLLRDLDSLRQVLEEEDTTGARSTYFRCGGLYSLIASMSLSNPIHV